MIDPIEAHSGSALTVAFGAAFDGRFLVSGGDDAFVRIWTPGTGAQRGQPQKHHGGSVRSVAVGTVGGRPVMASASDDGTILLWDAETGEPVVEPLQGHIGTIRDVVFTTVAGVDVVASAGIDGSIRLWDPLTGLAYREKIIAAQSDLRSIAINDVDGSHMIAASTGEGVAVADIQSQFDIAQLFDPTIIRSPTVTTDVTGVADSFDRLVIARHVHGVVGQLLNTGDGATPRNVVVAFDGRWGSGKSTLAELLVDDMQAEDPGTLTGSPVVIRFDAWRESAIAPHWWAIAAAINRGVRQERSAPSRLWMTIGGAVGRIARSPAAVSAVLVAAIAVAGTMIVQRSSSGDLGDTVGALQALLAGTTALIAAIAVATRSLFWASPALGRLHLRADDNPLGEVAHMVTTLRRWSPMAGGVRRPIVLVIDDLDRCSAATVVAYLETVHTILRSRTTGREQSSPKRQPAPLVVLVLADGRWVRTAFTKQYEDFNELGSSVRSLGGDFYQKLFDHTVLVPELTVAHKDRFLQAITGHSTSSSGPVASDDSSEPMDPDSAVDEAAGPPTPGGAASQGRRAMDEARKSVAPDAIKRREAHLLATYSSILPSNPRLIRRIANAWVMLEAINTSISHTGEDDLLVRAAITYVMFPTLVDELLDESLVPSAGSGGASSTTAGEKGGPWARPDVQRVLVRQDGTLISVALLAACFGKTCDQAS